MNNVQARRLAANEIKQILEGADLLYGLSLTSGQIASTNKVLFWRNGIQNKAGFDKNTYVVFTITASPQATNADNKVKTREVTVSIDIYTNKDLNTKELIKMVDKIENDLVDNNWDVEYETEEFDNDSQINHIPLTVTKYF